MLDDNKTHEDYRSSSSSRMGRHRGLPSKKDEVEMFFIQSILTIYLNFIMGIPEE